MKHPVVSSMPRLLTGPELFDRYSELLKKCSGIDVAVAWATDWNGLDRLLEVGKRCEKSDVRVVVGINSYITSPSALRKMGEFSDLRIFGDHEGKLFHPKLLIFKFPQASLCWVGSANLTRPAFKKNIEVVVEFEDTEGQAGGHFHELWNSNELRRLDQFDLCAYELGWKAWWAGPAGKLIDNPQNDEAPGPTSVASTPQSTRPFSVTEAGWQDYLYELRHLNRNLEEWVTTLDAGYRFASRDWNSNLSDREVAIMFGQEYESESFMPFGNLARALNVFRSNFCGISRAASKNRKTIGQAINEVRNLQSFSVDIARKAFENLESIKGCGHALTTRLLVFARPEWFVVANSKTFNGLQKRFEMPVKTNIKAEQYANLIQKIRQQPWSESEPPLDPAELRLWKYRAALLDPILYEGKVGDPADG
jgi:HKD family nuclease